MPSMCVSMKTYLCRKPVELSCDKTFPYAVIFVLCARTYNNYITLIFNIKLLYYTRKYNMVQYHMSAFSSPEQKVGIR